MTEPLSGDESIIGDSTCWELEASAETDTGCHQPKKLDQEQLGQHLHQPQTSMMKISENLNNTSLGSERPLVLLPCRDSLSSSRLRDREGKT